MLALNLNSNIKCKLNPRGVKKYYEANHSMPRIDKEGYTEIQLHRYINTFYDCLEFGKPMAFETLNIYIDEEELEKLM